jgi:hypothetical protein
VVPTPRAHKTVPIPTPYIPLKKIKDKTTEAKVQNRSNPTFTLVNLKPLFIDRAVTNPSPGLMVIFVLIIRYIPKDIKKVPKVRCKNCINKLPFEILDIITIDKSTKVPKTTANNNWDRFLILKSLLSISHCRITSPIKKTILMMPTDPFVIKLITKDTELTGETPKSDFMENATPKANTKTPIIYIINLFNIIALLVLILSKHFIYFLSP